MNDLAGQQDHGLAAFLLGAAPVPEVAQLRAARLDAFAYTALPADHPVRPSLRSEYLKAVARHHSIKAEVAPFIAAWRAAGIDVLLWKGFYLAEFVYRAPGIRFYGDVDVLIRSPDVQKAGRIAAELSRTGKRRPSGPPHPFRYDAYRPVRRGEVTFIDVHRYVLHRRAPWTTRQKRMTQAVWDRSIEARWADTTVRLPHPVDAALVCLLLHRAWGGDRWGLRPHDFLDLHYLIEREGVTRAALEARAAELGCRCTLAVILERCDPWEGRFRPGLPAPTESWRSDLRSLSEHPPFQLERWFGRALCAPRRLYHVLRALPLVIRVRRAARRQPDLHLLMAELTPPTPARRSREPHRRSLVKGVRWATRLLREPRIGDCVIRSLALYRGLRKQGWPVEFVSGVRRREHGWVGHAWVELDGQVLPELGEWQSPIVFSVNFRYPANPSRGRWGDDPGFAPQLGRRATV